MVAVQAPSPRVETDWLTVLDAKTQVNKSAAVNQATWEADPGDRRISLDAMTAVEEVRAARLCFITCCLFPALLTMAHSPQEAFIILRLRTKTLRISEAWASLWAWLRI